jgi:hypothetical protein
MSVSRFRPVNQEMQVDSRELQRLADRVRRRESSIPEGLEFTDGEAGLLISGSPYPSYIDLRINGGTNPYSWVEAQQNPNGTWEDRVGGVSGDASDMPLYEVNSKTGVAKNIHVRARLSDDNLYYWFEAPAGSLIAGRIRFHLSGTLATTDASKANCPVDYYWQGGNPGATVTVWNQPLFDGNYMFQGLTGKTGLASYDDATAKYWIDQMEC